MATKKLSRAALALAAQMTESYNRMNAHSEDRDARMDAGETNVLAQQLEQMMLKVYEEKYPALKARQFFNVNSNVDTGADSYSFERTNEAGEAAFIDDDGYADDLPTVETSSSKELRGIAPIGIAYHYTMQDIRRAAFMKKDLSGKKARKARRAYERKFDRTAAFGSAEWRIGSGLLNDADVDIKAPAAAGLWTAKTGLQMLADLNRFVRTVNVDSKEVYNADTILMPTDHLWLAQQTLVSATGDGAGTTVLEAFLKANRGIRRVDSWNVLAGAGAGSTNRFMACDSSPDVVEIVEPQSFEIMPAQERNLAFVVNCHGRTAGAAIEEPLGVAYMDGL